MYAIVEQGGKQYWVTPGETLRVDRIEAKAGDTIDLKVLWAAEEGGEGSPKGKAKAEVLRQVRGTKIFILRKKPKSTYSRQRGHRQDLTEIKVKDVSLN